MLFNIFAWALALSATAYSAPTPQANVQAYAQVNAASLTPALNGLRAKATALKTVIDLLDGSSSTQFLTGGGAFPAVINGIQDIAVNAQGLAVLLQNAPQIPAGSDATSVINAYQAFAQAQQLALNTLNEKLNANSPSPTVAAPLSAVLQNLQIAVTNLFTQLSARLATVQTPTPVPATNTNAIQNLLSTLTTTLNSLLAGLNVQNILNGLTQTLGQITGNLSLLGNNPVGSGGLTSGGLPALPFNLPINNLLGGSLLNLGTLPILSQLGSLTGVTGGLLNLGTLPVLGGATGGATAPVTGIVNTVNGLLGGILAKRVEIN